MTRKIGGNGRLYSNGGRSVFVSSNNGCPRINLTTTGKTVKLRDDFSDGIRVKRNVAKIMFV